MTGALAAVAEAIRQEGGLLAGALAVDVDADAPLGALAAAGPRAAGREAELAFVVEAVHEGWRLHAASADHPPRVLRTADADLALLAGDRLYALGLARLAELGDLDSVAVLADVIALAARAGAEGRPGLAGAAFEAGAAAVGWGRAGDLADAFAAALDGDPGATARLQAAARQVAALGR